MNGSLIFFIIYSIVAVVGVTAATVLLLNLTRKIYEGNSEIAIEATSYNKHLLKKALNEIILPFLRAILFMTISGMPMALTAWLTSFLTKKGILMETSKENAVLFEAMALAVFVAVLLGPVFIDAVGRIKEKIAKYKKKKEKYASLISEARANYPDFDSDKETRRAVLREIEEYHFSADDNDSFNQMLVTRINNILAEAMYRIKN